MRVERGLITLCRSSETIWILVSSSIYHNKPNAAHYCRNTPPFHQRAIWPPPPKKKKPTKTWEFLILQREVCGPQGPASASHQSAVHTRPYRDKRRKQTFRNNVLSLHKRFFVFSWQSNLRKSRLVAIKGGKRKYRWCVWCFYHVADLCFTRFFFLTDPEVALGWIWVEKRSQRAKERAKESTGSVRYNILLNNFIYCIIPLQHSASSYSAEFLILIGPGLIPTTAALTLIQLQIAHVRKWHRFHSKNLFAGTHLCKRFPVPEVKGEVLFSECIALSRLTLLFMVQEKKKNSVQR